MLFVDSNIPMYLVGAAHPNKEQARVLLRRALEMRERLVTNAEVLQEILHRYVSVRKPEAIDDAFAALLGLVSHVFPIEARDVTRARRLLRQHDFLSARDAVHLGVMERYGIRWILTFDAAFDRCPGLTRFGRT